MGLDYTPLQSGLLIMPQSLSALTLKMTMPAILKKLGYRRVLTLNTVMLGVVIASFATIRQGTPVWLIVVQAAAFGFFSSLQYTSMNTLAYADVTHAQTSMASTIVSTVQQMSLSFGVATASLVTAVFIPDRFHSSRGELMEGMRSAFVLLGAMTLLSSLIFRELHEDDGDNVSQHHTPHH